MPLPVAATGYSVEIDWHGQRSARKALEQRVARPYERIRPPLRRRAILIGVMNVIDRRVTPLAGRQPTAASASGRGSTVLIATYCTFLLTHKVYIK